MPIPCAASLIKTPPVDLRPPVQIRPAAAGHPPPPHGQGRHGGGTILQVIIIIIIVIVITIIVMVWADMVEALFFRSATDRVTPHICNYIKQLNG